MALVSASLQASFRRLYDAKPQSRADLAVQWASAYDSYASLAQTGNGGVVIAAGRVALLQSVLMAALASPQGLAAVAAAAWSTGITAYWSGTPFTPGTVPNPPFTLPGVSSPPVGVGALVADLTAIYSRTNTEDAFAQAQAQALDTCTKTVLVLFGATPQSLS